MAQYNSPTEIIRDLLDDNKDYKCKDNVFQQLKIIDNSFQVLQTYYTIIATLYNKRDFHNSMCIIMDTYNNIKSEYISKEMGDEFEAYLDMLEKQPAVLCPFCTKLQRTSDSNTHKILVTQCLLCGSLENVCSFAKSSLEYYLKYNYSDSIFLISDFIVDETCKFTISREVMEGIKVL